MVTQAGGLTFDHASARQRWQLKPDSSMNIIFYLALGTFQKNLTHTLSVSQLFSPSFNDQLVKMHTLI